MPTYDYECQACGGRFEVFQSITEGALRKCTACGKLKLRRLIGAGGGFLFKGSGFYQTDYRSSSYKEAAKKEQGGGCAVDGTGGAKRCAADGAPCKQQTPPAGATGNAKEK